MLRFDPFRDLDRLSDQLSRSTRSLLSFDAVRHADEITMYFDVPGVEADDLDVHVEKNELTVKAERRWNGAGKSILASERPQGTFTRQVMLSDALDTDRLDASLSDGVLIVTIPVDASSKQRRVAVKSGPSQTTAIGSDKNAQGSSTQEASKQETAPAADPESTSESDHESA